MIPFVDAHIHLWDLAHIRYAWLTPPFGEDGPNGSVAAIARNYGIADYRADLARWNVVGAVHVDAGADPAQAVDETRWLEAIADADGLPSGIVAYAPLDDPDVDTQLTAQAAHPHVRGIRQIVNWHRDSLRSYTPRNVTQDAQWQAGVAKLAAHELSFDLQCYPAQMPGPAPLFARTPDVPVIINHLGMPVLSDPDGIADWRAGLRALAAIPHVAIKLSGLGFIARDWTLEQVRPFVLEAIDLFGPDRCMIASDTPTDKLFAPIDRYLEAYHSITADFTDDDRRAMFGRNANRIYRLGLEI
ncbi:amidohydrolase family protein [Sphingomonas ginsenosidivorax]|uniref:Amidohydrolase family protein n=1 Tax=Sphingomonas ginsenosidivorax TaxID=862135 RepID=A0A5C6UN11_9SPHN|nr:amidohydrolase family protein [Sphingomonas ginsenosidivorax]TXC72618.1 amidohydrolase family protein [Sphingomonas ginsenosidivorax]